MKINFKFLTLAAAALTLGFASCSSDEEVVDNGIVPNGGVTYANIKLVQKAPGTYLPGGATEPATPQESDIKNALIYIFDASKTLEQIVMFGAGISQQKVETTTGTHFFYILANISTLTLPAITMLTIWLLLLQQAYTGLIWLLL